MVEGNSRLAIEGATLLAEDVSGATIGSTVQLKFETDGPLGEQTTVRAASEGGTGEVAFSPVDSNGTTLEILTTDLSWVIAPVVENPGGTSDPRY